MSELKCVSYNRVSTEEEAQLNAIENQIEENRATIKSMGWKLVDEYIDRGKSGTQIKRRTEFQRLMDDMLTDKFDIIVVKDQERLMRNTKDWYIFIDHLVQTGKKLYFYLENKYYTPDDALITGIKAIIAEDYSRNLSKKLRNYHTRRINQLKNGDLSVALSGSGNVFGWDKKDGRYIINPEQFKIRRLMCELLLQGKGSTEIARTLNDKGYRNTLGNLWRASDMCKYLYDPKNVGTIVINKEYRDFESKKIIKNPPEEWVYLENMIPPVVTPEEWERILEIKEHNTIKRGEVKHGKNIGKYNLSGKVVCGTCGKTYWKKGNGTGREYWICSTRGQFGKKTRAKTTANGEKGEYNPNGCDSPNASYDKLMEILTLLSEQLSANKEQIKADMIKWLTDLRKTILEADLGVTEGDLFKERLRKDKLLDSYLDGIISDEDYTRKIKSIEEKIALIQEELKRDSTKLEDIKEIDNTLANIDEEIDNYLDTENNLKLEFILKHLEKIIIYEDRMVIKVPIFGKDITINNMQYVSSEKYS